eukprot:5846825-Alexandrium_andersonii.AAC.1
MASALSGPLRGRAATTGAAVGERRGTAPARCLERRQERLRALLGEGQERLRIPGSAATVRRRALRTAAR